jgi:hypothetical protein
VCAPIERRLGCQSKVTARTLSTSPPPSNRRMCDLVRALAVGNAAALLERRIRRAVAAAPSSR